MDSMLKVAIENATEEERKAICRALERANDKPAVVVTMRLDNRRYVVSQEDEGLFEGVRKDPVQLETLQQSRSWFGGQWLRGYGRVDEMYRSLGAYEVVKVQFVDRAKVWGE